MPITIQWSEGSMAFSKEQVEKYLKGGGVSCPVCGSENIEGGDKEMDLDGVSQIITCQSCGKQWTDFYTLTDVEEIED